MRRIERSGDRHHGTRFGNAVRRGEHRRTTQTVTDQDGRRRNARPQMIGGGDQIIHVRGETGIGEVAFAGTQPGEIEAQHGNAMRCEVMRDETRRFVALAAGKAMREQSHCADRPIRPVKQRGEVVALAIGKIEAFGRHRRLLFFGPRLISG
jgi:hypothetical protein